MATPVTAERVSQFREDGYVFLPEYFDGETVERLSDEADRIVELAVNSSLANDRKSGRLDLTEDGDGAQTIRQVNPSLDLSRAFKRLARGELADLLRPLLDDEAVSVDRTAQLNPKMPLPEPLPLAADRESDRYPVHADWPYYEGVFPPGIVTSIVFLDECREDSGPLRVWPGSHTEEYDHERVDGLGLEVPPDRLDHDAGEPVLGPPGSVLLFDSRLVHSSGPNTSGVPRRLAIYGHAPESSVETEVRDGSVRPEVQSGYPSELVESTYEGEYHRLKRRGEFEDAFSVPDFDG
ncbi:MAG: phytanoyl-CoA dioxygenase family protein [Halobacteriaceae archaeon]